MMTDKVGEGRAVFVVFLVFSNAFDVFFHNSFIVKLGKHRLEKQTINRVENWLDSLAQRFITRISSTKSN